MYEIEYQDRYLTKVCEYAQRKGLDISYEKLGNQMRLYKEYYLSSRGYRFKKINVKNI